MAWQGEGGRGVTVRAWAKRRLQGKGFRTPGPNNRGADWSRGLGEDGPRGGESGDR